MYYVIRLDINGKVRYVFNEKLFVADAGIARKFYSLSYAKRYIKTHPRCSEYSYEIIPAAAIML